MALNLKPLLPREPIVTFPPREHDSSLGANTKQDGPGKHFCELEKKEADPREASKEQARKRLWIWGVY